MHCEHVLHSTMLCSRPFGIRVWTPEFVSIKVNEPLEGLVTTRTCKQFLPPANEVCEGYVFTGVCLSTGGMRGCSGGHAQLLRGGRAWLLPRGACMVAPGGCVVTPGGGACVVAPGGVHAWLLPGGRAWLLPGACVVAPGGHAWLL